MERKEFIKGKLREGIEIHKKSTITNALLNKAANDLYNAYRHLEMACMHCDDLEIRNKIESVKMMLGREVEMSGDFDDGDNPTVIPLLITIMDSKKGYF